MTNRQEEQEQARILNRKKATTPEVCRRRNVEVRRMFFNWLRKHKEYNS